MALINITSKQVDSDAYNERKVLATDINQIKGALQIGTYDIAPNNIDMEGTEITANGGSNFIRYNSGTNKTEFNDAGVWKTPEALQTISVTAGEDLAIRDVVYLKSSDGLAYKCDRDDLLKLDWIGVMSEAVLTAASGAAYIPATIVGGFSTLSIGSWYGLSSTPGEVILSDTNKVGIAISATQLSLDKAPGVITPIGSVMPWAKGMTGVPALAVGWLECDGTVINDSDSPLNGQTLPDLNTTQSFIRGASTSDFTHAGSETHSHTVTRTTDNIWGGIQDAPRYFNTVTSTGSASTLPTYIEMVFIMRVK